MFEEAIETKKKYDQQVKEGMANLLKSLDYAVAALSREEVIDNLENWLGKNGVTIRKGGKVKADNSREEMQTIERIQDSPGKQMGIAELREIWGEKRYAYLFGMSKILKYKDANKTMVGLGPKGVPHLKKLKDMAG